MLVSLVFEDLDPPTGTARIEGQQDRNFVGWLGLLHVLAELTAAPAR
jgi:hypothetical protein